MSESIKPSFPEALGTLGVIAGVDVMKSPDNDNDWVEEATRVDRLFTLHVFFERFKQTPSGLYVFAQGDNSEPIDVDSVADSLSILVPAEGSQGSSDISSNARQQDGTENEVQESIRRLAEELNEKSNKPAISLREQDFRNLRDALSGRIEEEVSKVLDEDQSGEDMYGKLQQIRGFYVWKEKMIANEGLRGALLVLDFTHRVLNVVDSVSSAEEEAVVKVSDLALDDEGKRALEAGLNCLKSSTSSGTDTTDDSKMQQAVDTMADALANNGSIPVSALRQIRYGLLKDDVAEAAEALFIVDDVDATVQKDEALLGVEEPPIQNEELPEEIEGMFGPLLQLPIEGFLQQPLEDREVYRRLSVARILREVIKSGKSVDDVIANGDLGLVGNGDLTSVGRSLLRTLGLVLEREEESASVEMLTGLFQKLQDLDDDVKNTLEARITEFEAATRSVAAESALLRLGEDDTVNVEAKFQFNESEGWMLSKGGEDEALESLSNLGLDPIEESAVRDILEHVKQSGKKQIGLFGLLAVARYERLSDAVAGDFESWSDEEKKNFAEAMLNPFKGVLDDIAWLQIAPWMVSSRELFNTFMKEDVLPASLYQMFKTKLWEFARSSEGEEMPADWDPTNVGGDAFEQFKNHVFETAGINIVNNDAVDENQLREKIEQYRQLEEFINKLEDILSVEPQPSPTSVSDVLNSIHAIQDTLIGGEEATEKLSWWKKTFRFVAETLVSMSGSIPGRMAVMAVFGSVALASPVAAVVVAGLGGAVGGAAASGLRNFMRYSGPFKWLRKSIDAPWRENVGRKFGIERKVRDALELDNYIEDLAGTMSQILRLAEMLQEKGIRPDDIKEDTLEDVFNITLLREVLNIEDTASDEDVLAELTKQLETLEFLRVTTGFVRLDKVLADAGVELPEDMNAKATLLDTYRTLMLFAKTLKVYENGTAENVDNVDNVEDAFAVWRDNLHEKAVERYNTAYHQQVTKTIMKHEAMTSALMGFVFAAAFEGIHQFAMSGAGHHVAADVTKGELKDAGATSHGAGGSATSTHTSYLGGHDLDHTEFQRQYGQLMDKQREMLQESLGIKISPEEWAQLTGGDGITSRVELQEVLDKIAYGSSDHVSSLFGDSMRQLESLRDQISHEQLVAIADKLGVDPSKISLDEWFKVTGSDHVINTPEELKNALALFADKFGLTPDRLDAIWSSVSSSDMAGTLSHAVTADTVHQKMAELLSNGSGYYDFGQYLTPNVRQHITENFGYHLNLEFFGNNAMGLQDHGWWGMYARAAGIAESLKDAGVSNDTIGDVLAKFFYEFSHNGFQVPSDDFINGLLHSISTTTTHAVATSGGDVSLSGWAAELVNNGMEVHTALSTIGDVHLSPPWPLSSDATDGILEIGKALQESLQAMPSVLIREAGVAVSDAASVGGSVVSDPSWFIRAITGASDFIAGMSGSVPATEFFFENPFLGAATSFALGASGWVLREGLDYREGEPAQWKGNSSQHSNSTTVSNPSLTNSSRTGRSNNIRRIRRNPFMVIRSNEDLTNVVVNSLGLSDEEKESVREAFNSSTLDISQGKLAMSADDFWRLPDSVKLLLTGRDNLPRKFNLLGRRAYGPKRFRNRLEGDFGIVVDNNGEYHIDVSHLLESPASELDSLLGGFDVASFMDLDDEKKSLILTLAKKNDLKYPSDEMLWNLVKSVLPLASIVDEDGKLKLTASFSENVSENLISAVEANPNLDVQVAGGNIVVTVDKLSDEEMQNVKSDIQRHLAQLVEDWREYTGLRASKISRVNVRNNNYEIKSVNSSAEIDALGLNDRAVWIGEIPQNMDGLGKIVAALQQHTLLNIVQEPSEKVIITKGNDHDMAIFAMARDFEIEYGSNERTFALSQFVRMVESNGFTSGEELNALKVFLKGVVLDVNPSRNASMVILNFGDGISESIANRLTPQEGVERDQDSIIVNYTDEIGGRTVQVKLTIPVQKQTAS